MNTRSVLQRGRWLSALIGIALATLLWTMTWMGLARAQTSTGAISGTVSYVGQVAGSHAIHVEVFRDPAAGPVGHTDILSPGGSYAVADLADGTCYVHAWLDATDHGGKPVKEDPQAWYDPDGDGNANAVAVCIGKTVEGIDIVLTDAPSPWTLTGGPAIAGGQVNALIMHSSISGTFFATVGMFDGGDQAKVYRSTDSAASWTPVYTPTISRLYALAASGSVAYAAGEGDGQQDVLVRSSDGGDHWTPLPLPEGYHILQAIAIHPSISTTLYVAGKEESKSERGSEVFRSLDGGSTWTRVLWVPQGAGQDWNYLSALAIDPHNPDVLLAAGEMRAGGPIQGVIYRSGDAGATWTQVLTTTYKADDVRFTSLLVHPIVSGTVYAGTGHNEVYRSTDGGLRWETVYEAAGFRLAFAPPNTVYASTDGGNVHASTSGGDAGTWAELAGPVGGGAGIQCMAVDPSVAPHYLYAGYGAGVFRIRFDRPDPFWEGRSQGIRSPAVVSALAVDPQDPRKLFAGDVNVGVYRSSDGGAMWSEVGHELGGWSFAINPQDSRVVYTGGGIGGRPSIYRSTDGGLTWAAVYTSPLIQSDSRQYIFCLAIDPLIPTTIYAGGATSGAKPADVGELLKSSDAGLHWTVLMTVTPGAKGFSAVAVNPVNSAIVYAGTAEPTPDQSGGCGRIYRSSDYGSHWTPVFTSTTANIYSVVVDYQKPNVVYASDYENRVYKSIDGGDTWSVVKEGQDSGCVLAIDPRVPSHVYLHGSGQIFETGDGGRTWSGYDAPINQGVPWVTRRALVVDTGAVMQTLYASLGGVWSFQRPAPQPGAALTVTVRASAPSTTVGSSITVDSLVVDANENWVRDGTAVTFATSAEGSFAGNQTLTAVTAGGRATATFTGVRAGTATVTVTNGCAVGAVQINVIPRVLRVYLPVITRLQR